MQVHTHTPVRDKMKKGFDCKSVDLQQMVLCVYLVVPTVRFDCGILGSSGQYKPSPIFIALRNITMYSAILVFVLDSKHPIFRQHQCGPLLLINPGKVYMQGGEIRV